MANGLVLRKDVDTLSDAELNALRDAYSRMMQIGDNRGYNYQAGLHGVPGFYCWHHRRSMRGQGDPGQLPTPADVDALYDLTDFDDFSDQLEDIHDQIHGWTGGFATDADGQNVGGDMGTIVTAAWDPVFWSHHGMIDRIWYLWQLKNGPRNIPSDYLSMVLAPFSLTVADVLDIHQLGYEYAQFGIVISGIVIS